MRSATYAMAIISLWLGARASAAEWGDLKGKFVYDGRPPIAHKLDVEKEPVCQGHNIVDETLLLDPDGGIANVVLYVRTKSVAVHPAYAKTASDNVTMSFEHCRFEPHILTMRLSQTLATKNCDPISHNINIQPLNDQPFHSLLGVAEPKFTFTREQSIPQPVACNIHPWMRAYVLVRSNPYAVVSGADGSFELKNLPAGQLEFQVWKEGVGYLEAKPGWIRGRFSQDIKAGANDLGTIKVSPTALKPKS